jgi:transcriptional regulator with XRE-family HTH domain
MDVNFRGLQDRLRQRLLAEIQAGRLTGLEVARAAGFRQAHISNFLNSKRGLSLEAMDAVLKARGWKLSDLLTKRGNERPRRRSLQANSAEVSWVPVVDVKNCHASEIPYDAAKSALKFMSARLERMAPVHPNVRGSWVRFVAMRVPAEEAEAMAPKLARGSVAIIDRHQYVPGQPGAIYAIRTGKGVVMRYVERVGREWVLRAVSACMALAPLPDSAEIVGRVCMTVSQM